MLISKNKVLKLVSSIALVLFDSSTMDSSVVSSLTEMLEAKPPDADPYVPVTNLPDDFLKGFDITEEDLQLLDEIDFNDEDFVGSLGLVNLDEAFQMDDIFECKGNYMSNFKRKIGIDIPFGRKKNYKPPLEYDKLSGKIIKMQASKGVVNLTDEKDNSVKVGVCKENCTFIVWIKMDDYYKIANKFNEEVGGKGTGMGFSAFFHNATSMCIAISTEGVIEPYGGDVAFSNYIIEVTGFNFENRETNADVVICKYLFNSAIFYDLPHHYDYMKYSIDEDTKNFMSFYNTAFDYETTERSSIVKKLACLISDITDEQKDALANNVISYYSEMKPFGTAAIKTNRNYTTVITQLEETIKMGAKDKNGQLMVPSPFRVLFFEDSRPLTYAQIEKRQKNFIRTVDWGSSTYHTWNINRDPTEVLMNKSVDYPGAWEQDISELQEGVYKALLRYDSFTHAHIQSCLLPKIHGKGGCFYDIYCKTGITWYRNRRTNLTWDCNYYSYGKPHRQDLVGIWHYNEDKGVYIGPTFKVNRQEIHYASVLPAKIFSMIASVRPLLNPTKFNAVLPTLVSLMGGLSNSSWMTSYRSGANRYLTCCHLSESGDLPALISGQLGKVGKKHRFPDFYLLKKMQLFIKDKPPTNVTPLFRLPFQLCSLEKDYSQMTQWHMRDANHATDCMVKITEAAVRHKKEHDDINSWLNRQHDFIIKMLDKGATYKEFKILMDEAPSIPTLNVLYFVALCRICKSDIESENSNQHMLGLSIWKMITDRHCTSFSMRKHLPVLKTSKVVESMSQYLRRFAPLSGMYELIVKVAKSEKLKPNYLFQHYKDSKEADREISQMYPDHRLKQNIPESLVESQTGPLEVDQMSDPSKFNKHISDTMNCCQRGRAIHASEDRAKFCQEQEPQLQGLCLAAIAMETGSTAMSTAASLTLMNKTRWVVYPHDCKMKELNTEDLEFSTVLINEKGKEYFTSAVQIDKNMGQGMGAVTGGAVNSVYVAANAKIIEEICPSIEMFSYKTTSDDVKRSANIGPEYNYKQLCANFVEFPNLKLNNVMMVASDKKLIMSPKFSEFNNVIATRTGMLPQSPIFSTLAVQPLLSKSIFGDLVDIINTSRSTLSWGCPPDTAEAALYSMLRVFRTKWLIDEDDFDLIERSGLLPRSMAQHISGFWIRDDNTLKKVYNMFTDDQKADVLSGKVPLYKMIKRVELDLGRKKKKKKFKHIEIEGLDRSNEIAKVIYAQRLVAESLMPRYIQPISHKERISVKNRFIEILKSKAPKIDISELNKLAPPKVICHTRASRWVDRYPCNIGTTGLIPNESIQSIRCYRNFKIHYRQHCSEEEKRISSLDYDEFVKSIAILERTSHYQGLSFKAPAGKPFTRFFDGVYHTFPKTFDFSVALDPLPIKNKPFTFKGIAVPNFKVMIWGKDSLKQVQVFKGTIIAFGSQKFYLDGKLKFKIFYKSNQKGSDMRSFVVDEARFGVQKKRHINFYVYYILQDDLSPLMSYDHKSKAVPYLPGVVGDADAILNYGLYCRSSSNSGFEIYQEMFNNFRSNIPSSVRRFMPPYPTFSKRAIEINQPKFTVFEGSNCISLLKLKVVDDPIDFAYISLKDEEPQIITKQDDSPGGDFYEDLEYEVEMEYYYSGGYEDDQAENTWNDDDSTGEIEDEQEEQE